MRPPPLCVEQLFRDDDYSFLLVRGAFDPGRGAFPAFLVDWDEAA